MHEVEIVLRYFSSVGIEADGEKVALVVKELAGKNLEEVIAEGTEKLGSVPSGGTGGIFRSLTLAEYFSKPLLRWRSCCCCSSCWWRCSCCCRCCCSSSQGSFPNRFLCCWNNTEIMFNGLFPRRRARRKMMTWASDSSTKLGALLRSQLDKLCHPQIVPCCLK